VELKGFLISGFVGLALLGCIEPPEMKPIEPTLTPDAGPGIPPPPQRPEAFVVDLRSLLEDSPDHLFGLTDGGLLTQTGTTVRYAPSIGAQWETLEYEFQPIMAAEALPWGAILIWTSSGFYVWLDGKIERSPISDIVPQSSRGQLLVAPGPEGKKDLWIAADDGLRLWRDEEAFTIRLDGFPTQNARLAYGAPWDGQAALWVSSASTVYALISTGTVTHAQASLRGYAMDELKVDFEGSVWGISDGRIFSRSWSNEWIEHTGLGEITDLAGHRDTNQLWIKTKNDGIWSHRSGRFQPIKWENTSLTLDRVGTSTLSFVGLPEGQAVLQAAQNYFVLTPGRYIELAGLEEGQLLTSTVTVEIKFSDRLVVDTIKAFVDEDTLEVDASTAQFQVSPVGLADGTHLVRVEVSYKDGAPSTHTVRRFSVYRLALPTWTLDIYPMFQQKCEVCHGLRGSARLLNAQQIWRTEIDRILRVLRSGTMPLPPDPPLTMPEIEKIEGWRAGGYLE